MGTESCLLWSAEQTLCTQPLSNREEDKERPKSKVLKNNCKRGANYNPRSKFYPAKPFEDGTSQITLVVSALCSYACTRRWPAHKTISVSFALKKMDHHLEIGFKRAGQVRNRDVLLGWKKPGLTFEVIRRKWWAGKPLCHSRESCLWFYVTLMMEKRAGTCRAEHRESTALVYLLVNILTARTAFNCSGVAFEWSCSLLYSEIQIASGSYGYHQSVFSLCCLFEYTFTQSESLFLDSVDSFWLFLRTIPSDNYCRTTVSFYPEVWALEKSEKMKTVPI